MSDFGIVRVIWDGRAVVGISVTSTRPRAYRLLEGRPPDIAVQIVPLLYNLCGKAQQGAALTAVNAAQGLPGNPLHGVRIACEAMQEHLRHLLLDWPDLLGLPQNQAQFVHWHGVFNSIAADQAGDSDLLADLPQLLLGMTSAAWQHVDTYAKLIEWMNRKQGLLASVAAALDFRERQLVFGGERALTALLPGLSAAHAGQCYAGQMDHAFAGLPQHDGHPMETGTLALLVQAPLLQDILRQRTTRLLARLIARLADLLDSAAALAKGDSGRRIGGVAMGENAGLSVVQTARGMLLHYVRIDRNQVAKYLVVAPTEWNFHPQGALSGLIGFQESCKSRLIEAVKLFVLSLDPCVGYQIEVIHA
ncbi:MAG: nickel-dependent hydrogenase large subunit [Gallionella sp.]|jgi:coenzyme F420-reducing hydrogenase alpha subunit